MTRRSQEEARRAEIRLQTEAGQGWRGTVCVVCVRSNPELSESEFMLEPSALDPCCSHCAREWNLRVVNRERIRAQLPPFETFDALVLATAPRVT